MFLNHHLFTFLIYVYVYIWSLNAFCHESVNDAVAAPSVEHKHRFHFSTWKLWHNDLKTGPGPSSTSPDLCGHGDITGQLTLLSLVESMQLECMMSLKHLFKDSNFHSNCWTDGKTYITLETNQIECVCVCVCACVCACVRACVCVRRVLVSFSVTSTQNNNEKLQEPAACDPVWQSEWKTCWTWTLTVSLC